MCMCARVCRQSSGLLGHHRALSRLLLATACLLGPRVCCVVLGTSYVMR